MVETVAILCGGRGTRLTGELPKPLVPVGGRPIVWHVAAIFAAQGVRRIVLLAGYRADLVAAWAASAAWPEGVAVECLDTGDDTPTGGRVLAAADALGPGRFFLTYGDGLADVSLAALSAAHATSGAEATMTVVRPELPFGVAVLGPGDRVTGFEEKPRAADWVNGGFFLLEREVLGRLAPDSVLEREPLAGLARAGRLQAFRHSGFWACMDTHKDALALNALWDSGRAPWVAK
jgi:glucose-1-phosphate cytidylyltransferase